MNTTNALVIVRTEHAALPVRPYREGSTVMLAALPARVSFTADFGITDSKGRKLSSCVTVTPRDDGQAQLSPCPMRDGKAFGAILGGKVVPADKAEAEAVKSLHTSAKRYAKLAAAGKL